MQNELSERASERADDESLHYTLYTMDTNEKSLKLNWMEHVGTRNEWNNLEIWVEIQCIVCSKHCINSVRWHKCQHCKMITCAVLPLYKCVQTPTKHTHTHTHTHMHSNAIAECTLRECSINVRWWWWWWCIHIPTTWENGIIANNFTKLNHYNYRRTH